jgi:hypothetical protein
VRITAGFISVITVIVSLIGSAAAADMTAADIKGVCYRQDRLFGR